MIQHFNTTAKKTFTFHILTFFFFFKLDVSLHPLQTEGS